jgi:proteasome lid subunit RPN8/RPN11
MIPDKQKLVIRDAAIASYDRREEACGLIVKGEVVICQNRAAEEGLDPNNNFVLAAEDLAQRGIEAIWHSHNNGLNQFSGADVRACRKIGLPFILHDTQNDRWLMADPSYDSAIEGNDFVYGLEDCYKVVCRYYWQNLEIRLTDYPRSDLFDEQGDYVFKNAEWNEFRRFFESEGFEELSLREFLKPGDVLLMQVGGAINANHIGVMIDPVEQIFLHHLMSRMSEKEVWDGYWRENTVSTLRRKSGK